jgi:hypothetical protein
MGLRNGECGPPGLLFALAQVYLPHSLLMNVNKEFQIPSEFPTKATIPNTPTVYPVR